MGKRNQHGNILKEFSKYTFLNIMGMLGLSCYILADTLFIANGVGSDGLTALNLVLPIYSFISGTGLMLGMGGGIRYAIQKGEHQYRNASKVFTKTIGIGLMIGFLFTMCGIFLSDRITELVGADQQIKPMALSYLRTILLFSTAYILNSIMICFIRNDGNPKLSMAAMLTGSFANIILDYIFLYPGKMGMFGAALATGLAPVISLFILSFHFRQRKGSLAIVFCGKWYQGLGKILSTGLPSFITEFSSGLIMLLFNFIILDLSGNIGVAAYGIIANLALIISAVFSGAAQGMQPVISKYYGEGNKKNVARTYHYAVILAFVLGFIFCTVGLLFANPLTGLFNRENNPVLATMSMSGIRLYFPAFLLMGFNIITSVYFAALSKSVPSFWISILRGVIAVVFFLMLLPVFFKMTGVWLVIPCAEAVTLMVSLFMLKKYK